MWRNCYVDLQKREKILLRLFSNVKQQTIHVILALVIIALLILALIVILVFPIRILFFLFGPEILAFGGHKNVEHFSVADELWF